jgi:hypothetical protein
VGPDQTFQEKANPGDQGPKCPIGKIFRSNYSEKQFKRTTVLMNYTKREDISRIKWRPLKITKTERFKEEVLMHVLSAIKAFQPSGRQQTHVFGQGLLLMQRQYDYCYASRYAHGVVYSLLYSALHSVLHLVFCFV